MITDTQIKELIDRYIRGEATAEEAAIVEHWFNSFASEAEGYPIQPDYEAAGPEIWSRLNITLKIHRVYPFVKYAAALVAVIGITWGAITYTSQKQLQIPTITAQEIKPGGNKAILHLANGAEISLNTQNGSVVTNPAQGVLISNNATAGIVTFKNNNKPEGNNQYQTTGGGSNNTITTPRGGQYQLILPDGTSVYLNASSTITFPSRFAGNTRQVSIIGEVYFQVAKDPKHPFIVTSDNQQLIVLGTQFNISAYPGETVKTTLAEGRVKLTKLSSGLTQPLKPDQQALLLSKSSSYGFEIRQVIASDEIGWIDGMFIFTKTPIKEAMKQISRWYDVEVDYNSLPDKALEASLSRKLTLAEVLEAIEYSGKFKFKLINERRLVYIK